MLHLANGDATRNRLARAGVPGRVSAWHDFLMEGPVPNGLRSEEDWAEREAWIRAEYGIPAAEEHAKVEEGLQALEDARKEDELVVWSEEDLFCQLNLAFALSRLADDPPPRISVVAPPPPGRVGDLPPERLAGLFASRRAVTPELLALGRRVWDAYASPDPSGLVALAAEPHPEWPDLAIGLRHHLARFPSTRNGLDALGQAALRELASGPTPFVHLFDSCTSAPAVDGLGIGDAQLAARLLDLAAEPDPLLTVQSTRGRPTRKDVLTPADWIVERTPFGARVERGDEDVVRTRGVDRWLGGVRLEGHGPVWRWDGARLAKS